MLCVGLVLLTACGKSKNTVSTAVTPVHNEQIRPQAIQLPVLTKTKAPGNESSISGRIIDANQEGIAFGMCVLSDGTGLKFGTQTDIDGFFVIKDIPPGEYLLEIRYPGYESSFYGPVVLYAGYDIVCDPNAIVLKEVEVIVLKPVIYLYPEDTLEVHLQLQYKGELMHTYPRYEQDGWHMTAFPDGTLRDAGNRSYYALYWEGRESYTAMPECGNVVPGGESIAFLERSLDALGLSNREANEFIMYWLPLLEKNPYNLIHFATTSYEASVPVEMTPAPDQSIRIMMTMVPLQKPITYPAQPITGTPAERKGFVLVEWGGQIRQPEELPGWVPNQPYR